MVGDGGREVIGFWTCLESGAAGFLVSPSLGQATVSLPRISVSVGTRFSDKKESCSLWRTSNQREVRPSRTRRLWALFMPGGPAAGCRNSQRKQSSSGFGLKSSSWTLSHTCVLCQSPGPESGRSMLGSPKGRELGLGQDLRGLVL